MRTLSDNIFCIKPFFSAPVKIPVVVGQLGIYRLQVAILNAGREGEATWQTLIASPVCFRPRKIKIGGRHACIPCCCLEQTYACMGVGVSRVREEAGTLQLDMDICLLVGLTSPVHGAVELESWKILPSIMIMVRTVQYGILPLNSLCQNFNHYTCGLGLPSLFIILFSSTYTISGQYFLELTLLSNRVSLPIAGKRTCPNWGGCLQGI